MKYFFIIRIHSIWDILPHHRVMISLLHVPEMKMRILFDVIPIKCHIYITLSVDNTVKQYLFEWPSFLDTSFWIFNDNNSEKPFVVVWKKRGCIFVPFQFLFTHERIITCLCYFISTSIDTRYGSLSIWNILDTKLLILSNIFLYCFYFTHFFYWYIFTIFTNDFFIPWFVLYCK